MRFKCKPSALINEVYRGTVSAHIQPNAAKLTGCCFTVQMDNDPTQTVKATRASQGKEMEYSSLTKSIT